MSQKIYVLHEYGAPSHYNALVELGHQKGFDVIFRVFSPRTILTKFWRRDFALGFNSILFLLSLPFRRKEKIILGIAPFNPLLKLLFVLLKKHEVYYHTSYTHWDGSMMAYPTSSQSLMRLWRKFLGQKVRHIFAVSNQTKQELIANKYIDADKITVVNHSYKISIPYLPKEKDNTFLFVGRIVPAKGISELLEIFAKRPEATLTLVGRGELEPLVEQYAKNYPNINYLGYINGLKNLIPIYQQHSFVVMNSQRMNGWEELFGIALIEGMACGCVPITTDHPGPKEIITSNINGYISTERSIGFVIDKALCLSESEYQRLRSNAISSSEGYHSSVIAKRWENVLK